MHGDSTSIGGPAGSFPSTSWSLVRQATLLSTPEREERLGRLFMAYWKPVYSYIRTRWRKSNEDAKDLTQGFFALILSGNYFQGLAPEHGTLRGYLKRALENFLVDDQRRAQSLKRGGSFRRVEIDLRDMQDSIVDPRAVTPEELFDREWIIAAVGRAAQELQRVLDAEGRGLYYRVFEAYYPDLENFLSKEPPNTHGSREGATSPTYEEVAARLGIVPHDVSHYLGYARRKILSILREQIGDTAASESDALREIGFILGE